MKEFVLSAPDGAPRGKIDYAAELNPEQLDVVLHGDGPCLVLAGAGSGKTRTVTYRVAHLIEQGVDPEEILLVTFTNKAAREMLSRTEALLGADLGRLWGGTFHSVANRILRRHAPKVGRTSGFTILDQEDARSLLKACVADAGVDTKARRFPSPNNLLSVISFSRNAGIGIEEALDRRGGSFVEIAHEIERVARAYEERKAASDAMDFDDLLILLRNLLRDDKAFRERLSGQFRYVLVDEYQDTNVVQAEIVRSISSAHGNVLVVGDDAQSIYSFRAAEIKNILGFSDAYERARVFRLTTNYRSTPEILSLANAIIKHNDAQLDKELAAVRESGDKPSLVPCANASQEARYIAEQALALRDDGTRLDEIAVLFRAAFHSQALEFELMKRDIPYEYRGGMKFFERAHVKDIVSHLRLAANPRDEAAWMRVLGLQTGIGLVTAGKIYRALDGLSSVAELEGREVRVGKRAQGGWEQAREALVSLAGEEVPADMIRDIASGAYRSYLEAEYPDYKDRLEDIEQFALFAEQYQSLSSFLDEISLAAGYGTLRPDGEEPEEEERLVLSTVHQAKGLEWDAVFVMHMVDGKFPNQRALHEHEGLEEERRLFYVAVTRAQRRLFVTYPIAGGHDAFALNQPSTFILELPEKLFEEVRLRQERRDISSARGAHGDDRVIVLDDLGEEVSPRKAVPSSFLRGVDEL